MPKTVWTCEICEKFHDNEELAKLCENDHIVSGETIRTYTGIDGLTGATTNGVPDTLKIVGNNGGYAIYKVHDIGTMNLELARRCIERAGKD